MDITAQEILNSLFNPNDTVCFRVFDPNLPINYTQVLVNRPRKSA